jgi:hypothetical protein
MPSRRFSGNYRRLLSTLCYFFDDFVGSSYENRAWSERGSGGSISIQAGGVVRVRATAGNTYEIYQGDMGDFSVAKRAKCTWLFKVSSLSSISGEVGFMGAYPSSATDWMCVIYSSAKGSNWYIQTATGGSVTELDTGVAADTGYHEATIECVSSSSIRYYIDGVFVGELTTNITTLGLQPYVYIVASGGLARDVLADWVECVGNRE